MSGKEKVLAVLMGAVEVRQVFRDWPADMNLAVCLMPSGDCQLVVSHQDEADLFPLRLQRHLNLDAAEMCVFPPVPGFATRSLLYSDERRLLALVAEAPAIVEEASDYSVNYAYALEEGLNPAVFLGVETGVRRPPPEPAAEFVSRRNATPQAQTTAKAPARGISARTGIVPSFLRREVAAIPGPRFRSASDIGQVEDQPERYEVHPERNGWILIERIRRGGADIRVSNPETIFLRDDRRVVAIRLEPPWPEHAGLPGRVWIQARNLPQSIRTMFDDCVGAGQLTVNGAFLYLQFDPQSQAASQQRQAAPPEPRPEPELARPAVAETRAAQPGAARPAVAKPVMPGPDLPEPVAPPKARRGVFGRRGRRRILAMTGVASVLLLIGLGLQLGGYQVVGAGGPDASIDWDQFRITWRSANAG